MGKILSSLQNIKGQLALAIQHAPKSPVLDLHNHSVDKHLNEINNDIQAIDKQIESVFSSITEEEGDDELSQVKEIEAAYHDFLTNGAIKCISLIRQNKYHDANELLVTEMNDLYLKSKKLLEGFIEYNNNEAKELFEGSESDYQGILVQNLIIIVVGAIVALFFSFMIIRGIHSSVTKLQIASGKLAEGDMTTTIEDFYNDELGQVCLSFNQIALNKSLILPIFNKNMVIPPFFYYFLSNSLYIYYY